MKKTKTVSNKKSHFLGSALTILAVPMMVLGSCRIINQSNAVTRVDKADAVLYTGELDSSYTLDEDIDLKEYHQFPWGSCWSFATTRAIETYLALHGEEVDLSRLYPLYTLSYDWGGEVDPYDNEDHGSNFYKYMEQNDRGFGEVLEADVPYSNAVYEMQEDESLVLHDDYPVGHQGDLYWYDPYSEEDYEYFYNLEPAAFVTHYVDYSKYDGSVYSDNEIETIKRHIMVNGSLYALTVGNDTFISDTDNNTIYTYESIDEDGYTNKFYDGSGNINVYDPLDHAISIIGWDDDYSRDNFTGSAKPTRDGAFVILDSDFTIEDGEISHDKQIKYVSYEDRFISYDTLGIIGATTDLSTVVEDVEIEDAGLYKALKNSSSLKKLIAGFDDATQTISFINTYDEVTKNLNLAGIQIGDLSQLPELFPGLEKLDLSHSTIDSQYLLDNFEFFEDLDLDELDLSYNNIDNLLVETVDEDYYYLGYILNLSHNNITSFGNIMEITSEVDLSYNPLTEEAENACDADDWCYFYDFMEELYNEEVESREAVVVDLPYELSSTYMQLRYHPWTRFYHDDTISIDWEEEEITFAPDDDETHYISIHTEDGIDDWEYSLKQVLKVGTNNSSENTDPNNGSENTDPNNNSENTDPNNNSENTDPNNNSENTDPNNSSENTDPNNNSENTNPNNSSENTNQNNSSENTNPNNSTEPNQDNNSTEPTQGNGSNSTEPTQNNGNNSTVPTQNNGNASNAGNKTTPTEQGQTVIIGEMKETGMTIGIENKEGSASVRLAKADTNEEIDLEALHLSVPNTGERSNETSEGTKTIASFDMLICSCGLFLTGFVFMVKTRKEEKVESKK